MRDFVGAFGKKPKYLSIVYDLNFGRWHDSYNRLTRLSKHAYACTHTHINTHTHTHTHTE